MKKFVTIAAALAIFAATPALAQPNHDDHSRDDHGKPGPAMSMHGPSMSMKGPAMSMHGPSHADWKKGGHIGHDDWGRGVHVDYRAHHLKRPPRGYEWREVDGNYILAAAATGLIASMILASH
jgi:Ni/Co efflux regulator RcnB